MCKHVGKRVSTHCSQRPARDRPHVKTAGNWWNTLCVQCNCKKARGIWAGVMLKLLYYSLEFCISFGKKVSYNVKFCTQPPAPGETGPERKSGHLLWTERSEGGLCLFRSSQQPSSWAVLIEFLKFESHCCIRLMPGYFTEKYFVAIAILFHSSNLWAWLLFRHPLAVSTSAGIVPGCRHATAVKCVAAAWVTSCLFSTE